MTGKNFFLLCAVVCTALCAGAARAATWDHVQKYLEKKGTDSAQAALLEMNTLIREEYYPQAIALQEAYRELRHSNVSWWKRVFTWQKPHSLRAKEANVMHRAHDLYVTELRLEHIAQEARFDATVLSRLCLWELLHAFKDCFREIFGTPCVFHDLAGLHWDSEADEDEHARMLALQCPSDMARDPARNVEANLLRESPEEMFWAEIIFEALESTLVFLLSALYILCSTIYWIIAHAVGAVWIFFRFAFVSWMVLGRYSSAGPERVLVFLLVNPLAHVVCALAFIGLAKAAIELRGKQHT